MIITDVPDESSGESGRVKRQQCVAETYAGQQDVGG